MGFLRNLGALFGLILALFSVQSVLAHASLVSSEPLPGETLEQMPRVFRLTFTDVLGDGSEVVLLDDNFGRISLDFQLAGETVVIQPPDLAPGVYTMQYDVLSEDGHTVSGSYEFAVAGEEESALNLGRIASVGVAAAAGGFAAAFVMRRRRSA